MRQNGFYSHIKSSRIILLVSACLLSQAVVPASVQAEQLGSQNKNATTSAIGGCPIFPSNNIWNTPIDNLPVHARSAQWINSIGRNTGFHMDFGTVWDGGPIGIPYNVVGSGVTKVPVSFDYADESDPGPYPIPPHPLIEAGGDSHILIVDTSTCKLYELYAAYKSGGQWYAGSGAIWDLNSNALRPAGWTSADAAGLPILPGLVRYDEVLSGEIDHAIRFTASRTAGYIWPARHLTSAPQAGVPPMGARFRLKASYNISGYPATLQVILRAMKKYGIILADNGSNWYISGAPDSRWDDDMLHLLDDLSGDDFEAVDSSGLMVNSNSGATGSTISGNVGVAGVTLSYVDGTAKTVTSAANGTYSLMVTNNWSGTVMPAHPCFVFDPVSTTYSNITSDQTDQNYTRSPSDTPCVSSITRVDANPTGAASINFNVTFSESVTGVDTTPPFSDFKLTTTGVAGAAITAISGSGSTRTVTVNTGSGNGMIRLDVPNTATIIDSSGNSLGNLPFTGNQVYAVAKASEEFDDTDPRWAYSAGWQALSATGPYNGTYHRTSTQGSTATFTFQGPAFFIFTYRAGSNRGSFQIWVDGVKLTPINAYSATTVWQKTYLSPAYADHLVHTVMIKNISPNGIYIDVDAMQISPATLPSGPGRYDDIDPLWLYSSGWTAKTGSGAYNGTFHITGTKRSSAAFVFQAPAQFVLYYRKSVSSGSFEVWVDGALLKTINAYSTTTVWQKRYTSPVYGDAKYHTLVIKKIGPNSTSIDVDAIEIVSP